MFDSLGRCFSCTAYHKHKRGCEFFQSISLKELVAASELPDDVIELMMSTPQSEEAIMQTDVEKHLLADVLAQEWLTDEESDDYAEDEYYESAPEGEDYEGEPSEYRAVVQCFACNHVQYPYAIHPVFETDDEGATYLASYYTGSGGDFCDNCEDINGGYTMEYIGWIPNRALPAEER